MSLFKIKVGDEVTYIHDKENKVYVVEDIIETEFEDIGCMLVTRPDENGSINLFPEQNVRRVKKG